jgi:hypothetical protein
VAAELRGGARGRVHDRRPGRARAPPARRVRLGRRVLEREQVRRLPEPLFSWKLTTAQTVFGPVPRVRGRGRGARGARRAHG